MVHETQAGIVVSDLDGTLLHAGSSVSRTDLDTLRVLGEKGIIRTIATGRSLYSARPVLPDDFPLDYLIFSSGAGIVDWKHKHLLHESSLTPAEVENAVEVLLEHAGDYMVHERIPDNHFFTYHRSRTDNPDFDRRWEIYREFATKADFNGRYRAACQIVAIEPPETGGAVAEEVRRLLPGLKVIRTTSPLDRRSVWIEIFPRGVSKASAAEWICLRHGLGSRQALGIGNDYNDLDLLEWASAAVCVGDVPAELVRMFPTVGNRDGFSEAVSLWRGGAALKRGPG
jgi:HAD superfamily hydrolase (TIGR01484 family)